MNRTYKVLKSMHIREIGLFGAILVLISTILVPMLFAQPEPRKVMAEEALSSAFTKIVKQNDGTLFVLGKYNWLLKGSPDAQQWERLSPPIDAQNVVSNVVCNGDSGVVVYTRHGQLYRSLDNGRSWHTPPSGVGVSSLPMMGHLPSRWIMGNVVGTGSSGSGGGFAVVSPDFGTTWDTIWHPDIGNRPRFLGENLFFAMGTGFVVCDLQRKSFDTIVFNGEQPQDFGLVADSIYVILAGWKMWYSTSRTGPWRSFTPVENALTVDIHQFNANSLLLEQERPRELLEMRFDNALAPVVSAVPIVRPLFSGVSNVMDMNGSYLYGGAFHSLVQQYSPDSLKVHSSIGGTANDRTFVNDGVPSAILHEISGRPTFVNANGVISVLNPRSGLWELPFSQNPFDTNALNSLRGLRLVQGQKDTIVLMFGAEKWVLAGEPLQLTRTPQPVPGRNVTYAFVNDNVVYRQYFSLPTTGQEQSIIEVSTDRAATWENRRELVASSLHLHSAALLAPENATVLFYQRPSRVRPPGQSWADSFSQPARYEIIYSDGRPTVSSDIYYHEEFHYQKLVEGPNAIYQGLQIFRTTGWNQEWLNDLLVYQPGRRAPTQVRITELALKPVLAFSPDKKWGIMLIDQVNWFDTLSCRVIIFGGSNVDFSTDSDTISGRSFGQPRVMNDSTVVYIATDHIGRLTISNDNPSSVLAALPKPMKLFAYPNPTSGAFKVGLPVLQHTQEAVERLVIINSLGEVVGDLSDLVRRSRHAGHSEFEMHVPSELPSGAYRLLHNAGALRVSATLLLQR